MGVERFDLALTANKSANINEELSWLQRAIMCCDSADNADMSRRARAHMQSLSVSKNFNLLEIEYSKENKGTQPRVCPLSLEAEVEAMRAVCCCAASGILREAVQRSQQLLLHLATHS